MDSSRPWFVARRFAAAVVLNGLLVVVSLNGSLTEGVSEVGTPTNGPCKHRQRRRRPSIRRVGRLRGVGVMVIRWLPALQPNAAVTCTRAVLERCDVTRPDFKATGGEVPFWRRLVEVVATSGDRGCWMTCNEWYFIAWKKVERNKDDYTKRKFDCGICRSFDPSLYASFNEHNNNNNNNTRVMTFSVSWVAE